MCDYKKKKFSWLVKFIIVSNIKTKLSELYK